MKAELITDKSGLDGLCKHIDDYGIVCLDIEFIPERTYYPRVCLVQCCVDEQPYIIDPFAIKDLMPLWKRIEDPAIKSIFHAASQDLDIIYGLSRLTPRNVFDTQVAAGFAGYGYSAGYRRLLSEVLNVQIPKTESFSDWQNRPLSESQLEYAVNDVLYLKPLYESIEKELEDLGRLGWALEECRAYEDDEHYNPDRSKEFMRLKGASRLNPRALAILRELWSWRDEEARHLNKPQRTLLSDNVMIEIARRQVNSVKSLKKLRGIRPDQASRFADEILDCVKAGAAVPSSECPTFPSGKAPTRSESLTGDFLFFVLKMLSDELNLATEHLATRDEIQSMVRLRPEALQEDNSRVRILKGWRREVAGEKILAIINGAEVNIGVSTRTNRQPLEISVDIDGSRIII